MKVKYFLKDVTGASRVTKARLQAFEKASAVPVARDPIREAVQERHPDMTEMVVTEIRPASPTSKTIRFARTDGKKMPIFYAGQYVSIALPIGSPIENSAGSSGNGPDHVPNVTGRIVCRPYSISSAPYEARAEEEPFIEITVRNSGKDGFAAEYLCNGLKAGDHLLGSIGHGQFYYEPLRDSKKIVALAGGAGITPFASMAKEIAHGTMDAELTLLYGSVSADDIVLKEELEQIDCPRVKIVHVLSGDNPGWKGEKGFLDAELIRRYAPEDASFFICGPQAMYRFLREELKKLNIPARRIRYEVFGQARDVTALPGYPAEKKDDVYTLTVRRGIHEDQIPARACESLVTACERAGIILLTDCRSGECGFCRTKVISGEYYVSPENDGRRAADKDFNYIHACAAYPLSDMTIKIPIV